MHLWCENVNCLLQFLNVYIISAISLKKKLHWQNYFKHAKILKYLNNLNWRNIQENIKLIYYDISLLFLCNL